MAKDEHAEALFCCTDVPSDATFLAREDVPYVILRRSPFRLLLALWLPWAMARAFSLLQGFRPTAVFSKGGIISVPVVLAARVLGIPVVLHESDTVSGRATKLLARFSAVLCRGLPFDREKESSAWKSAVYTGNPVRRTLSGGDARRGMEIASFNGSKPVLLVMGGSQGAAALNAAVRAQLDALLPFVDIVHLTGRGKEERVEKPGYFSLPFATWELPHFYAMSALALSRAGAGAVSELALYGLPSILVPLEGVAQNHQLRNAETLAQLGACVLLRQEQLDRDLVPAIRNLLRDEGARNSLSQRLRQVNAPSAAEHIAGILCKFGK